MPMIQITTNQTLSDAQKASLQAKLGNAITLLPGKSEAWLMIGVQDEQSLCFRGDAQNPAAFVNVKLFGSAAPGHYQKLSAAITELLQEEAAIPSDRCYVQYDECSHWAWNGSHF